ncbi:MAG TPA: pyrimidine 5'-nucleotidase [Rhizomicrobium sp.]|jgi:putative hydrolase of the HAD superfamily
MQVATAPAAAPDFRHVDVWIFDLDNTLYRAETGIFAQIEARMTAFVQRCLGLGFEESRQVQKTYYREHGTTMNGLVQVHGINPEDYLAFVHDIDLSALAPDMALTAAIGYLPGRRFVFTNGCRNHAARILERLGIAGLFEDLWDIRTLEGRPKPDLDSYRAVLARASAVAARSAMFDDIARNLVPAYALGCTTVWVNSGSVWSRQGPEQPRVSPTHIHYETADLCAFLQTIRI